MSTSPHPWMLTGPWYRWAAPGVPEAGRNSKPEIQKYAGFEFAAELLREPQRSLKWQDEDFFHRTFANPNRPPPVSGPAAPGSWLRERTAIRKLFKPTHARNYVVVVELHCDVAGFPSVDRREVTEAGFVVRRLKARVEDGLEQKAEEALSKISAARHQVDLLERNAKGRIRSASGQVLARSLERPALKKQFELLEQWKDGHLALDELAAAGAFGLDTEAWIPDVDDPLRGRWTALTDPVPREHLGGESVLPLYPLIPDPRLESHSAVGRTLYFGVIPVQAREVEADGSPRYDDRHLFEVRCFVRRPSNKPQCPGDLVWSEPTIGYRIAPDLDPEGAANLPISITVPSFRDLQALADRAIPGGLRIVQPPDSVMPLSGTFPDAKGGPPNGVGQICFMAIILLFIIALFLVFIFLPIIVFLFQLFFLLALKFCILPSISLQLDLAAHLKLGADLKTELDAKFEAGSFDFAAPQFAAVFKTEAEAHTWANARLLEAYGEGELMKELRKAPITTKLKRIVDLCTDFRGSLDAKLLADLNIDPAGAPPPGSPLAPVPSNGSKLEYFPIIPLVPKEAT